MAKHSVDVIVKARDEASRKFGVITASAKVMGKALKGSAAMIKTAFRAAFQVVKRAAIGIAAAFAYATYAAIKQEAAEIELASALKMTGEYTEANLKRLKEYAAAIQDATTYGDEEVLMLMRMAMTLGWTADQAGAAAKAAIALFEGFGGGRGKPAIFMRYYTDAVRGTGSSLESYVGELRKAKTEQERQIVMQNALARGWDVAKSKADSAGGALKQMKNAIGDVAEVIGQPFLPTITSSAKAIKQWAKDNKTEIGMWAEKTHSYIVLVKDMFMDFVKFMKEDWRSGIQFVFDSFVRIIEAAFKSAIYMAIEGGKGIWKAVKEGLSGKGRSLKEIEESIPLEAVLAKVGPAPEHLRGKGAEGLRWLDRKIEETRRIMAKERYEAQYSFFRETKEIIAGITIEMKQALTDIIKDMPPDLGKAFDESFKKYEERLKGIKEGPGKLPGKPGTEGWPQWRGGVDEIIARMKGLAPLESRFLTFGPGVRFNYEQETAKNTKEQVRLLKILVDKYKSSIMPNEITQPILRTLEGPTLYNANFK